MSAQGAQPAGGHRALYDRYLTVGLGVPAEEVELCRADARIALVNLKVGVKSVLGTPEQILAARDHLPMVDVDGVLELPDMARALLFATRQVVARRASQGEIDKAIQDISKPREQGLAVLEILGARGVVDAARVAKIRAGTGKYDMAQDGLDVADIFLEKEMELAGLHPFTRDELQKLRATSEWLLENLTPEGARAEPKVKKRTPEEEGRDRIWTLILKRFPDLRRIGFYFHPDQVDEVVPKLQSRVSQAQLAEEPLPDETADREASP
ncbi:MAG TPA: hypothetical protein VLS89_08945 [Candidatus Nanopelagicales bacterium]|nr:hypothetical protein [Candidatus Nanopelagicales bacterium]